MKQSILKIVNEVDQQCRSHCRPSATKIHGINHLRQVAYLAGRFAASNNTCVETAVIGGYLHDCARQDDSGGNAHAHESAELAKNIITNYYPKIDADKLYNAIYYHADGLVSRDPLLGYIWDADRITLTRLGITPQFELLSTEIAKRFCGRFINQSELFLEIQKISTILIRQITLHGEAILGVWCGDLSIWMLKIILTVVEGFLDKDLSKLRILSLYEYCDLSKTNDQSTCYQIYNACHSFASFRPEQVICPLHDSVTRYLSVEQELCYIFSYEYPHSPCFEEKNMSNEDKHQICKIDMQVRDYRSRYFERYNKTSEFINTVSPNIIKMSKKKIILVDRQLRRQYKLLWKRTNQLERLLTLHEENASIYYLSKCPTELF